MTKNEYQEQQIEELKIALSRFSHELRNPIALVSSGLQFLCTSHPEVSFYQEWEDIMENIEYIKELLNELSDYNNADKLTLEPTDLSDFLHTVTSSFRPALNYLGIKLEERISSDLPVLSIDKVKFRQALLNLLRNAQEAVSSGQGEISFCAQYTLDRKICISVCDNGCGIDLQNQKNIFSPFVTYKKNGTGLGLSITRQIIEAHHGTIEVKSYPGQGSKFQIFLDEIKE